MTVKFILGMAMLLLPVIELALFNTLPRTWTPRAWFTLYRMALTTVAAYNIIGSSL